MDRLFDRFYRKGQKQLAQTAPAHAPAPKKQKIEEPAAPVAKTEKKAVPTDPLEALRKLQSYVEVEKKFPKAVALMKDLVSQIMNEGNADDFFQAAHAIIRSGHIHKEGCRKPCTDFFKELSTKRELFKNEQQEVFELWIFAAITNNELYTDDTYIFHKVLNKLSSAVDILPNLPPPSNLSSETVINDATNTPSSPSSMPAATADTVSDSSVSTVSPFLPTNPIELARLRLDFLFDFLVSAHSFIRVPWAKTAVNTLLGTAYLKRFNFRPEQTSQIDKWISDIKNKTITKPAAEIATNSDPLQFKFQAKDGRDEVMRIGGLDNWTGKQAGLQR